MYIYIYIYIYILYHGKCSVGTEFSRVFHGVMARLTYYTEFVIEDATVGNLNRSHCLVPSVNTIQASRKGKWPFKYGLHWGGFINPYSAEFLKIY